MQEYEIFCITDLSLVLTGFPDNMVFGEFRQRFQGLLPPSNQPSKDADMKQVTVHPSIHKNMSTNNGRTGDCHR